MVHADYALPLKPGHGLFPASTNGLASGNHPLEAICSALCEIVERDAVALWHHTPENRQSATRLTLASIDDSVCRSTCQRIQDASLDVSIWDVTSDLGVPCFMCLIHDPGRRDGHIGLGTAANPDKAGALLRALTEAAQTRLTYITGSRDDLDPDEFTPAGLAQKRRFAERLLGAGPPARSFADVPSFRHDTFRAECDWLLQRLRSGGIEQAVAIDLSREDIGIPVVRVIVPGLEAPHDDAGYVPGPRALAAGQGAGA
jgi:ribosomal protein S12 methylthiotransferase accessory factor